MRTWAAAIEQRQVVADSGAHDTAFAAKHFEELGAQVALGEFLDRLQDVASTLGGHDLTRHQVFLQVGGVQDAAADGKTGRRRRRGGGSKSLAITLSGKMPPSSHIRRRFRERQHRVHLAGDLGALGLHLLCDARPDENDLHVVAIEMMDRAGHGHHRRHDGRQLGHQLRIVSLDEADDRRTGRGDEAVAVALQQEFPVSPGDQVRAEGPLLPPG